jgi:hypothetical protein
MRDTHIVVRWLDNPKKLTRAQLFADIQRNPESEVLPSPFEIALDASRLGISSATPWTAPLRPPHAFTRSLW